MTPDDAARLAVAKHRRLLCVKTLELALGELVALCGVEETKKALKRFQDQLEHY